MSDYHNPKSKFWSLRNLEFHYFLSHTFQVECRLVLLRVLTEESLSIVIELSRMLISPKCVHKSHELYIENVHIFTSMSIFLLEINQTINIAVMVLLQHTSTLILITGSIVN
jgi:hypothetical protein